MALASVALTSMTPTGAAHAGVIPLPAEIDLRDGQFALDSGTRIVAPAGDREALFAAQYLVDLLARSSGLALQVQRVASMQSAGSAQQSAADPTVVFEREPGMAAEGYRIVVGPQRVEIAASTGAGLMYGAVTLWELLPPGAGGGAVPAQIIHDQPAYAWRGLMLDSVRHFQSPEYIKSMLDWMGWHKLNVLHWHLTDDQGWRLQIKRYPRLTSVGAWRIPAAVTSGLLTLDDANYGGFYTQSDVRSIVAYAAERHIDIVPEIEMPGHAQAAIAAYPQLGSTDGATPPTPASPMSAPPVSARWGVHNYLFNLEPDTFRFFENVLTEVMQLFPSHYVHIGGDEAVKDQWLASPAVQARAAKLGISDPEDLQGYFTQTIGAFIAKHGRRMVGWDEIMRPGLDAGAVVMSWRGAAGAHAAALAGNDTVLAPWPALYFDNRQSTLPSEPPGRIAVISLQDVYNFDPYDKTLTAEQRAHLLGVQANLWTEHIQTEERVQLMALPRAAAVAEVGWTPAASRNWNDFLTRLGSQFARYQALGVVYSDSVFGVASRVRRTDAATEVTLSNQGQFGAIRFTTDGHDPTAQSATYAAPLALPLGTELRAATFLGEQRLSGVLTRRLDRDSLARRTSHELQLCSDGVALILEPSFALDIENPCWIRRGVDLSNGPAFAVSVGPLPFNYEIGADVKKIVVGDARTANGEFEIRVDGCDQPAAVTLPLPQAGSVNVTTRLQGVLPARPGRHDLCLRFARPGLDPMWGLDWVEIRE